MRSSTLERIRPDRGSSIVVLTGAGISKESGLDTFRDADGIWSKVRIEDVATYEASSRTRGACTPSTTSAAAGS